MLKGMHYALRLKWIISIHSTLKHDILSPLEEGRCGGGLVPVDVLCLRSVTSFSNFRVMIK